MPLQVCLGYYELAAAKEFFMKPAKYSALFALLLPTPVLAQALAVPFNTYCPPDAQAACFGTAEVMGLNPNGDGFLAVRTGPGSDYEMIAKIHNGDIIGIYDKSGDWYAISFRSNDQIGWTHGKWLGNFIP